MSDNPSNDESVSDAFRLLGDNLLKTMRSVWDAPERKKLQSEIETGLADLADTVRKEIDSFNESPTGQRFKSDMSDLHERVRSTVTEASMREELLKALRLVNAELEKAASKLERSESEENPPDTPDAPQA